jgi:hypothetical protein
MQKLKILFIGLFIAVLIISCGDSYSDSTGRYTYVNLDNGRVNILDKKTGTIYEHSYEKKKVFEVRIDGTIITTEYNYNYK